MLEIFGYITAIFVGFAMGLMGGGGSILAVPIFAYLFHFDEKVSTAYSLFIVGTCAIVGATRQRKNVDFQTALSFGIPSTISVWLTRKFVIPLLPCEIFKMGDFILTRRMLMFGVFATLMLIAARSMIKDRSETTNQKKSSLSLLILGIFIGLLTGFVGAGGGFLIVPALVLMAGLDIKKAIGTSLAIIAFNSMLGFLFGDALQMTIDWQLLGKFAALALTGIFIGSYVGKFVDGKSLKKGFAVFVILMAIFIFTMEFIVK